MAIENSDYTSVMIKKETKQQLEQLKQGKNISYSKVIENLIQQTGGCIVEDVITIPSPVAFTLKYWDEVMSKSKDITFRDLADSQVGRDIEINISGVPQGDFVNSWATVMAKDDDNIILKVTEVSRKDGKFSKVESVVHIQLF